MVLVKTAREGAVSWFRPWPRHSWFHIVDVVDVFFSPNLAELQLQRKHHVLLFMAVRVFRVSSWYSITRRISSGRSGSRYRELSASRSYFERAISPTPQVLDLGLPPLSLLLFGLAGGGGGAAAIGCNDPNEQAALTDLRGPQQAGREGPDDDPQGDHQEGPKHVGRCTGKSPGKRQDPVLHQGFMLEQLYNNVPDNIFRGCLRNRYCWWDWDCLFLLLVVVFWGHCCYWCFHMQIQHFHV